MAFVSLAHIMAYRSNAMPLFQHETEARTKHLHSILLFTNLPFAPEKCYLRWMLHYGAISGIGWVSLEDIEHLTDIISHSHIIGREVLNLTVPILLTLQGFIS